jgi:arsenate reductase-like glutaredoxin family protein
VRRNGRTESAASTISNRPSTPRAGHSAIATTIQIFGFNDCQDTRKAQRFFAERRIPVHYVDLNERPASKGELRRFADRFGAAALVDKESARYKTLGLRVALDSPARLLDRALTEPRLLRTPLVRNGGQLTIGLAPADWQTWVDAAKSG